MEIVTPFECAKCGFRFTSQGGGICSRCRRPFCSKHIEFIKSDSAKAQIDEAVCLDCLKDLQHGEREPTKLLS
jgi:hypothetical protein